MSTQVKVVSPLANLAMSKIDWNETQSVLDLGLDELLFANLNSKIQFLLYGCSFKTDGGRIESYTIASPWSTSIVTYKSDNLNNSSEHPNLYPTDEKWIKYCGSLSSVTSRSGRTEYGSYTEYKDGQIYRSYSILLASGKDGKKSWTLDGPFSQFFPNGVLEICGNFFKGKMSGLWRKNYFSILDHEYAPSIMLEYYFGEDGVMLGEQKGFLPDGTEEFSCEYEKGKLNGWYHLRASDYPEYDSYSVLMKDGKVEGVHWSIGESGGYEPDDTSIDPSICLDLPVIYDPTSIDPSTIPIL